MPSASSSPSALLQTPSYQFEGGPIDSPRSRPACIGKQERLNFRRRVEAFEAELSQGEAGPEALLKSASAPDFTFFPIGGQQHRDLTTVNYVDLDPAPWNPSPPSGILDWDCTDFTYDGHRGNDTGIRTFEEQALGVPIVAAADGIVVDLHDGEWDLSTDWTPKPANYVIVSHGGGWRTLYWHMKKNSVAVTLGQSVTAGEQLGLIGSSGVSTGPHLHFEVQKDFSAVEPFAGTCGPAESLWDVQTPIARGTYVDEFAFYRDGTATLAPPGAMPRDGYKLLSDDWSRFWFFAKNLPANSTWRTVYLRPDGSMAFDSGPTAWGNPSFYRGSWWTFLWGIPEFKTLTGEWRLNFYFNGRLEIDAPFTIVSSSAGMVNRAPEPIEVRLEPSVALPGVALRCVVDSSLIVDDLDYDIVRYSYVWKINGQIVRTFTGAGQADLLPGGLTTAGSSVVCEVTPMDGTTTGPQASANMQIDCSASSIVTVPASANLFAAGHGMGPAPAGLGHGTMPQRVDLLPLQGTTVRLSNVSGLVGSGGVMFGADGNPISGFPTDLQPWEGISGIKHANRVLFLAGVFVDASEPAGAAPATLDFTTSANYTSLAPQLGQTFFIGDGLTGTGFGTQQILQAPSGATRLYLGFMDGVDSQGLPGAFDDNTGAIELTVQIDSPGGPNDCNADAIDDKKAIAAGCSTDDDADGVPDDCESLVAYPLTVSMTNGQQTLKLSGKSALSGAAYLVLGSATGTTSTLSLDGIPIPLSVDFYTTYLLQAGPSGPMQGMLGALDASGQATATFSMPIVDPALIGSVLFHAWIGFSPQAVVFASTAEPLVLVL